MSYRAFAFKMSMIILLILSCLTCSLNKEKGEIMVKVPVIHNPINPVAPPGIPSRLNVTEDLIIVQRDGDEELFSCFVRNVEADEEGNIYVLDCGNSHIKVFDSTGQFQRAIGGKKEFNQPTVMHLIDGKKIMILDFGNIHFYTSDGIALKRVSIGKYKHYTSRSFELDSRGNIVASLYHKGFNRMTLRRYIKGTLSKSDQDFRAIKVIDAFEDSFSPPEYPAFIPGFRFKVRKDDSVVWAFTTEYELQIFDADAVPIKKIIKDYEPRKITEEDKKEISNDFRYEYGDMFFATYDLAFPENFPAMDFLATDDIGRIYIKTYQKDGKDRIYWDVFDPEGRYITCFSLPKRELIYQITNNFIYTADRGTWKSSIRKSVVKRYRMEWE